MCPSALLVRNFKKPLSWIALFHSDVTKVKQLKSCPHLRHFSSLNELNVVTFLITKISIFSVVVGLKKLLFFTNLLAKLLLDSYRTVH